MTGHHHHHHGHSHAHLTFSGNDKLRIYATWASVSVATTLIIAKLIAYFLTDSIAILSSLVDSTVDLLASLVTVFGVISAMRPPDRDHRFGHGKAEPLAALAQAAFIIGSSVLLCYEALSRFYEPHEIRHADFGYGVMIVAVVLTAFLLAFQRYVIKRTKSMAIGADHLHYAGDLGINIAVMISFFLQQKTGMSVFDPLFALLISGGLIYGASRIAQDALNVLMDRELPDEDREKIRSIVLAHPEIRGVHDMRTRSDSDRIFVEFHLELDPQMTLIAAHGTTERIMAALGNAYPNIDVIIHQDPAGHDEDRLDQRIDAQGHTH